ncbi:MAG: DNA polymerase I [Bacteroidetes bacterium]|nr:DNA polymerase I [Bacteroidota bacterium]
MNEKKLFLLDGHALVYRAHFAFITRPLINSKGLNTSAINGFTRMLWDLLRTEKPTHIAVAFDPHGPTFRHEQYPKYKANREEQPEDIGIAIPWIQKILKGFHIPILCVPGFEADDVIGTIAKKASDDGFTVYMVTPDKDYGQLVSPSILMYKPSRQGNGVELLGEKEICEMWDIQNVNQVIDILGLQGDSVDNIPGVPGIGPKTAAALLKEYGSLENILANAKNIKGKNGERLIEFAEQARLSYQLATIEINVPIAFDATDLHLDPLDRPVLSEIFKELEFRSISMNILGPDTPSSAESKSSTLMSSMQGSFDFPEEKESELPLENLTEKTVRIANFNIENTPHTYHLIEEHTDIKKLVEELLQQESVCFDTETDHIDATLANLVGLSFAYKKGIAWYIAVPEKREKAIEIIELIRPVLENEKITLIGQNIKFDAMVMKNYGVEISGPFFDTMIAHYLLEPELRHNMDYLSESYLDYKPVSITSLIGKKGNGQKTMREVPKELIKEYAAEDADITLQLKNHLKPLLVKENLIDLFNNLEVPLLKVLADMEYEGIRVDVDFLKAYSIQLKEEIKQLENKIYELAGSSFNIASPKQVGEILFDKLKIPYKWRKTKSGQYATDEEKLAELDGQHPIIGEILNHRGLSKLKSTYVDALPNMVNPNTKRIHSSFNQALTATGRLSSNNPNLQNIPIRTEEGARVRQAFIPRDEHHVLVAADYSQIELRIIAEISGDEGMLEAFQKGQDIHRATAAKVFGIPYEEVTKEQRYRAKTVNFSIIYGAGSTNLSKQLGITRNESKALIDAYFLQYHGLKAYMEKTVDMARKKGYVMTLMGRKRILRDIHSNSSLEKSNAERMAINTPIQGSAADLIKMAMLSIHEELKKGHWGAKMILQVHDELVFDVPVSEVEKLELLIRDKMCNAMPDLKVPIEVEVKSGNNWLEAH